jgi:glyoxylase-like metal-dependent hydrolase (beta-lactamase superfamily II)
MINIHQLTYGPFSENTYVLSDSDGNALIIDPGMYFPQENAQFLEYLQSNNLKPVRLILTHAHLDHVFGVNFVNSTFDLTPEVHQDDMFIYTNAKQTAVNYGLAMDELVEPNVGLEDNTTFEFGGARFQILLAPGHSPGSVCFYCSEQDFVISGDVLFQGSIGRTDLPGGSYDQLMNSIRTKLMPLTNETVVYSGHGPLTTIGQERMSNPFINS